jgi:hypothetical protein
MIEYLLVVFDDKGWIMEKTSKLTPIPVPQSAKYITCKFNKKPFKGKIIYRGSKIQCKEYALLRFDPSRQTTTDDSSDEPILSKKKCSKSSSQSVREELKQTGSLMNI